MVRDWSKDEEDDASAYKLNPQKKRSEQTRQGGSTPPLMVPIEGTMGTRPKTALEVSQEGQTPPVGPTPSVMVAEERARLPPQDEGQGSSAITQARGNRGAVPSPLYIGAQICKFLKTH
jgi:hypothetical protein